MFTAYIQYLFLTMSVYKFNKGDIHFLSTFGFSVSHHTIDALHHQEELNKRSTSAKNEEEDGGNRYR